MADPRTPSALPTWHHLGYAVVWLRANGTIEGYADEGAHIVNYRAAAKVLRDERAKYSASDPKRCRIVIVRGAVR